MSNSNLVGNINEVDPVTSGSNLENTKIYELVKQDKYEPKFTFNMLSFQKDGRIKEQRHDEQHVVYIIDGQVKILLGQDWTNVGKGNYIYIPPNMTHSFVNEKEQDARLLILKI